MIYTPLTHKALLTAYQAHLGQTDRSGLPYIFHPFHLAEQMDDEVSTAAALLHDVVEDTNLTLEDLAQAGFSPEVLEVVDLLTHDPAVSYMDYIQRIVHSQNPIAKKIKLADLKHNSDLSRLDTISPKDQERLQKYRQAAQMLTQ